MSWLVAIPVVLPLLGAGVTLAFSNFRRVQWLISVTILSISLAVATALVFIVNSGPLVFDVGEWAAPVGITLVADRLSALMLLVSVAVTLAVLIYSLAQGVEDGEEAAPTAVYHPAYLILSAGVSNAFLTGDLFNLFVGFEILLAASFVLITMGGTRARIRSGTVYVVVSMLSSIVFLIAIVMTYAATGTLNFAQLATRLQEIDPGVSLALQAMLLVAFGIKAALFPLHAWLPDSYPTAPAPVTAVFAGLLTKVGVYAIIRTQVLLFPQGRLDDVLSVAAILTMVVGILGAVTQRDIKRMLSFTLVSHIGFMIWGISVSTEVGLAATIFYVIHHITVQTALFLVAGLIERHGGSTSLQKLGSLAKSAPVIAALYLIPALGLAGIPPMTGFLGKVGLISASAQSGQAIDWWMIGAGLVTSLLTLYAVLRAWNLAFWQEPEEELEYTSIPVGMYGAAGSLVVMSLGIALFAGPIYSYAERAAIDLERRGPYIVAVLPDGNRGTGTSEDETDPDVADELEDVTTVPAEEVDE
ncbi:Na+/H+ antiporter subunit D [Flaviflexus equikiangi]|uniref:Na+/H+ antiporter subunit D n=1 Tax=Flaviflexus equikiangi TaxID=2758573 RepID=A0ABS2TH96_9ACTO|nr:Na+/H+ antiporter subunit D [Flaviflexus equikiangi]MBM9434030.1 Na+/H+ antiporter subunit D [Flaviflexus equikiangi]